MHAETKIALVDLGGTQIRVAISDAAGSFLTRLTRPTPSAGGEATLEALKEAIRAALDEGAHKVAAIAIVAPGPLDPRRGVVIYAPNVPDWHDVPLADILRQEFSVPVLLGNDANLAALGEQWFGAGRGHHDLVYLTVSTGIGGGVISEDKLLIGSHGYAAELGHNSVWADGPLCNCGNRGCVETLASGPAIARQAREAIQAGRASVLSQMAGGDLSRVDARMVAEAARQGDVVAQETYRRAGYFLGVAIVNFLYTFDPTIVVLGGGVTKAGPLLFEPVIETVHARAPRAYWEHCDIVQAALGEDVGLRGALALYLSETGREREG
ncbi:MAG: ROK family protein [Anaerolineae bacterium]|nr:ROK family protein [Anaerolineae bacterium]